ncbi:hypothetical protein [Eubacterium callanderi]|nr:hypothetical protein [Eubacterium callanderi]
MKTSSAARYPKLLSSGKKCMENKAARGRPITLLTDELMEAMPPD